MTSRHVRLLSMCARTCAAVALLVARARRGSQPEPGTVLDEAKAAGVGPEKLTAAADDYVHDIDGGIALSPAEIRGRNTWIIWTGGNDRFWDIISTTSFGAVDFLKTISSYPYEPRDKYPYHYDHDSRWKYLGLVSEPCYKKATGPDPKHFGLWLDQRDPSCPPDPFADEQKYPRVKTGARGKTFSDGKRAARRLLLRRTDRRRRPSTLPESGVDEAAEKAWDATKFYADPTYHLRKRVIKPYRVGMSCGSVT